jgi:tRNA nucleotidyltransferase/poly(A) polymerase
LGQRLAALEAHPHFSEALAVADGLRAGGFKTFLVGGCVRDAWLGKRAMDLDLATSALPEDVEKLFPKTIPVGKAFGTVIVVMETGKFEVTTFRRDGAYLDGRRPSIVEFSDAKEDALRRDFTINALFYDPMTGETIDYVNGLEDLSSKIIRTVGEPALRFDEDKLRILRAIRFSAQLGFDIELKTWEAIKQFAPQIGQVSRERVYQELLKILGSDFVQLGLERLIKSGLATQVFPSLSEIHRDHELWQFFCKQIECISESLSLLALIGFLSPNRKAFVSDLESLKPPRQVMQTVQSLIQTSDLLWSGKLRKAERIRLWTQPFWRPLLELSEAVAMAKKDGLAQIEIWIKEFLEVCDETGKLPKPYMTGEDLLALGFVAGPKLGTALEEIYLLQLESKITSRLAALEFAKNCLAGTSSGV